MDIVKCFEDFSIDVKIILNNQDKEENISNIRVCSVALRIIGFIGAIAATKGFLTGVSLLAFSPITSVALLVLSAVGFAISRDFIQVGINQSNAIKAFNPMDNGVINHLKGIYSTASALGQEVCGINSKFNNTWILKHFCH